MTQISARLDCVENVTRQRHDRDQTENQQNAATVDSYFELVGSRQQGVAQQKVEQPARAEWSTKRKPSRVFYVAQPCRNLSHLYFGLIRSFADPAYTCSIFVVRLLAYCLLIVVPEPRIACSVDW